MFVRPLLVKGARRSTTISAARKVMVACSTTRMVGADSTAVPMGPEVVPEVVVLVPPSGMPGLLGAVPVLEAVDAPILLG